MKSKIKILIVLAISLSGCINLEQGDIVTTIEQSGNSKTTCLYNIDRNDHGRIFRAPCGLYKVGDTVKFTK